MKVMRDCRFAIIISRARNQNTQKCEEKATGSEIRIQKAKVRILHPNHSLHIIKKMLIYK